MKTFGLFETWLNSLSAAEKETTSRNIEKLETYGLSQDEMENLFLTSPNVLEAIISRNSCAVK